MGIVVLHLCSSPRDPDAGFLGKVYSVDKVACRRFIGCFLVRFTCKEVRRARQDSRRWLTVHSAVPDKMTGPSGKEARLANHVSRC